MDEAQKQEVETVDIVMSEETKPIEPIPQENPQLLHNDIQPQKEELSTGNPQTIVNCPVHGANKTEECPNCRPYKEETKLKNLGGRPCEYCRRKEEVDKITKEYILEASEARNKRERFIPYQQELAIRLDIDNDTLYNWTIKKKDEAEQLEHPGFFGLIKKLNTMKELMLLQRTTGRFNPTGAIFQLKTKHGYIETEKQLLGNADDKDLRITIVEEEK